MVDHDIKDERSLLLRRTKGTHKIAYNKLCTVTARKMYRINETNDK